MVRPNATDEVIHPRAALSRLEEGSSRTAGGKGVPRWGRIVAAHHPGGFVRDLPSDELARFEGCLLGLAVGDAIGYPHEFRRTDVVRRILGPAGITDFIALQDPRFEGTKPFFAGFGHPPGTYTDDTQMTLALAEGLLDAPRGDLDEQMAAVGARFVEWARSDDNNRSPGGTCMTGCDNLARGVPWRDAGVAESKGCGSAMRTAPIGLFFTDLDEVERVGRASSLLTHGHPAGLEGAAAAALLVALALRDATPEEMYEEIDRRCSPRSEDFALCWRKIPGLVDKHPDQALVTGALGESWVAEEAVASALYCYWRNPSSYERAVLEAINTEGDSDSIGCIAGSLLGARLGRSAIPARWVDGVENRDGLLDVAGRLHHQRR